MQAALRAGVERIVHTSSVATIALRSGEIADESTPMPKTRQSAHTSAARLRPNAWSTPWW